MEIKFSILETPIDDADGMMRLDSLIRLQHKALNRSFDVCSFWLRDHCRCPLCYNKENSQRKFNITDIPLDIEPTELKTESNNVSITCEWKFAYFICQFYKLYFRDHDILGSDGHASNYDICDLYNRLHPQLDSNHLEPILWSAADIVCNAYADVTYHNYLCNDEVAKNVVASLVKFGCAFIKNVPNNLGSTKTAVERLFPIQKTHFSDDMWSFSANRERNDSAYTNEALPAHNDTTYFNDAVGLQILHCISRSDVDGGDTILVDGFHVLKKLHEQNADAYENLSQTSIPSEYIEDGYNYKHCAPIIVLDTVTSEPNQIR